MSPWIGRLGNHSLCLRLKIKLHYLTLSIQELKGKHKGQGRERLDGSGRKLTDDNLEEIILEWIHGRRASGLRVSRTLIMIKAEHLYDERCPESNQRRPMTKLGD